MGGSGRLARGGWELEKEGGEDRRVGMGVSPGATFSGPAQQVFGWRHLVCPGGGGGVSGPDMESVKGSAGPGVERRPRAGGPASPGSRIPSGRGARDPPSSRTGVGEPGGAAVPPPAPCPASTPGTTHAAGEHVL